MVLDALEHAFRSHPEIRIILTAPAPDPGFEEIERRFAQWCDDFPDLFIQGIAWFEKLSFSCCLVIGSGGEFVLWFAEVPGLGVPTLNIGTRQEGRVRANSIIDAAPTVSEVGLALCRILSPEFQETARQTVNPLPVSNPLAPLSTYRSDRFTAGSQTISRRGDENMTMTKLIEWGHFRVTPSSSILEVARILQETSTALFLSLTVTTNS